jgi:hypothetical protein
VSSLSGTCPNLLFVISGSTIYTDGSTRFRAGNCSHVKDGLSIAVTGVRESDGRVRATDIDLKP